MREVLPQVMQWWRTGDSVAVATVVDTWRSAPQPAGASMAIGPDGTVVGSVSGGCVEGAVYEVGQHVLANGIPVLQRYGVSDDDAYAVGLTCGGVLDVLVERVSREAFAELGAVNEDIEQGRPVAVATIIEHPDVAWVGRRLVVRPEGAGQKVVNSLGSSRADDAVIDDARGLLATGRTGTLEYGPDGERRGLGMRVFVASFAPKPRMLVFGAIDFAAAVATVGAFLGYHVTVCDARPIFATKARFAAADEVVVQWPHRYLATEIEAARVDERTVMCVLTHDPKFDVPVLRLALQGPRVAYIGAMGSRSTHEDRETRLRDVGVSDADLDRLSSPIGLDLGARTPQETAVSIAAEIIANRWGGRGERLAQSRGPIHHHGDAPHLASLPIGGPNDR